MTAPIGTTTLASNTTHAKRSRGPATPVAPSAPATSDTATGGLGTGAKLAIGGGVAAALLGAGGLYLALRGRSSQGKVLGCVDGVRLLGNPNAPTDVTNWAWKTPTGGSVYGTTPKVSLEHVDQGALGDCWNIAAMGAIAHRQPGALERLVREVGDDVVVDLPRGPVAVTKELPIRDGSPVFGGSKPDDPVFWPAYIEKAQAAIRPDGYRTMEGGQAWRAFDELLGTSARPTTSTGSIGDDLAEAHAKGEPLTIWTYDKPELTPEVARRMDDAGVHDNHVYVVTNVTGRGDDVRAELFNPWGRAHPTRAMDADDLRALFGGMDTPSQYLNWSA